MTSVPFNVSGIDPSRWRSQRWWKDAPEIDLPPTNAHLVVLAAHPDDETLGLGGLLFSVASRIHRITVLVGSDGAASHPNSPTVTPPRLAEIRARELADAMAILAPAAEIRTLGSPDGKLVDHQPAIVNELEHVLGADTETWLLSTWLHDGHPDHAACALAAREVAGRRRRIRYFEYPIWYWHIGDPEHAPETLRMSLRKFPLRDEGRNARSTALRAYASQIAPLSTAPGDEAVLPAAFLDHFDRDCDVLLDVTPRPACDSPPTR